MNMNIDKAIEYAVLAHAGETRKNKKNNYKLPYISHPLSVMRRVWDWGFGDYVSMASAVLHDVVENAGKSLNEIEYLFGIEVANTVGELTFDETKSSKEEYIGSFGSKSDRALCVKLSDRFDNVLDFYDFDKQYAIKYYKKADSLFVAYNDRKKHLIEVFGENCVEQIDNSFYQMSKILRG